MATVISKTQTFDNTKVKASVLDVIDLMEIKSIENKLNKIFHEDKKLETPVFLFIKEDVISKLAYFLAGYIKRPAAIGVAGATASGKSSFAFDLIESIVNFQKKSNLYELVTRINADDYYFDRSDKVKEAGGIDNFAKCYDFDVPEAIDIKLLKRHIEQLLLGNSVKLPKYMMDGTCIRYDDYSKAYPRPVIISEGLFNLNDQIKDGFDFCIYVDVSNEAQSHRWFERAKTRGLVGEAAQSVYNKAMTNADIYVNPTVNNADIVVNGEASRDDYRAVADKILEIVQEFKFSQAFKKKNMV